MGMRWKVAAALAAAGVMGTAGAANAQAITFTGNTFGCFYTGSLPGSCTNTTDMFGQLTYSNSTFNVTSNYADGQVSIGDVALPATPNINNLGSFTLVDGGVNYTGQQFALVIDFSAPPGSPSNTYSAVLSGNLVGSATGNVSVDFDNSDQYFTFADGTILKFNVNDVALNDKVGGTATVAVTGQGVVVSPEPASMTLLATGLVGIFGAARRRRKNIAV